MRAEIISIGDELTSGQRLDTNSQWLSLRLGELGVPVLAHVTVADDLEANVDVFRQAVERAEVVVATGGLGPTADDLTREALARLTGRRLVLDQQALDYIKSLFARRRRDMPERNVVQAMFPEGSRVLPNPEGTAPGIDLDVPRTGGGKCRIFALPGVPAEMKQMWYQTVAAAIAAMAESPRVIRHKRVKCFGVGESAMEQMLPDLIQRGRDPSVGITVHEGTISLRITAGAPTGPECHAHMESTLETIHGCLGHLVFGYEEDELQHAVGRMLQRANRTLAVCEWATAGLLAEWLGEVEAARSHFLGGVTVTSAETARQIPGLRAEVLARHGSASAEVARALAEAVRQMFAADYGLAVSDFPSDPGKATGDVFYALAGPDGTEVKSSSSAAHSAIIKPLTAKSALNLVRLALLRRGA